MNDPLTPQQHDELCDLITALHEKSITETQLAQLEAYVCCNDEACRIYVQYTHLYANLRWRKMQELEPTPPSSKAPPTQTPVVGFLGDVFHHGVDFFSQGLVVSLLLAVGLPAAVLAILLAHIAHQPMPMVVAQVVQTHECVWSERGSRLPVGVNLLSGQRVCLAEGLVKIAFSDGANVIVQGPATFEMTGRGEGFLHVGKLVASVPKGAEGFAIRTPSATVIDFGTEFGVSVEDDQRSAEVQVFQGEVAMEAGLEDARRRLKRCRLTAGRAARVESAGRKGEVIVREIPLSADRFVRRLPAPAKSAARAILADFSGGNGASAVDQFPGVPGSGWASGWRWREAEGMKHSASVEQTNPMLGGGDYLRVLIERESGRDRILRTLERRLNLTEQVDLTKPYVVSFNFRLDALNRFSDPVDHLIICNNAKPEAVLKGGPWSGWHIRLDGRLRKNASERHWAFVSGSGTKGKETKIDSGIPAVEGSTYSFRIVVDPQARKWTPLVSVNGGKEIAFKSMGTRSPETVEACGYWPYLYFYWMLEGGNRGEDRETLGFSVDSIRITAADPEAAAVSGRTL